MADLENVKGWFQFIVAIARRKIVVGHAHFGSREDTYLSHDSASKLPLTLSARDAYIYAQKSPTLPRGLHIYINKMKKDVGMLLQKRAGTRAVGKNKLYEENTH